jgi:2-keto-4-pentenoate hydratase/2-oxohepta-3-ene-1,7-dioic acid hydratase in catechol pathway
MPSKRRARVIPRPAYASDIDVECELAAVVGVGGRDMSVEQARDAIVGYTIFNDVSYREIQRREMAFGLGPTKGKDADHSNVLARGWSLPTRSAIRRTSTCPSCSMGT